MTSINEVMAKAYEREKAALEQAEKLTVENAKEIERMMVVVSKLAGVAICFRKMLKMIEEPLRIVHAAVEENAPVTTDMATAMTVSMNDVLKDVDLFLKSKPDATSETGETDYKQGYDRGYKDAVEDFADDEGDEGDDACDCESCCEAAVPSDQSSSVASGEADKMIREVLARMKAQSNT